jgi:hypothetical protein
MKGWQDEKMTRWKEEEAKGIKSQSSFLVAWVFHVLNVCKQNGRCLRKIDMTKQKLNMHIWKWLKMIRSNFIPIPHTNGHIIFYWK